MQRKGFTLVESVVVIGIISILASLVLMFSYGIKIRKDLDSTTISLAAVIREAQQKSITQEDMIKWGVYLEANTTQTASFYSLIRNNKSNVVSRYKLPGSIEFDTALLDLVEGGFYEKEIIFSQVEGLPGSNDVLIKIMIAGDPSSMRQIVISNNGSVSY